MMATTPVALQKMQTDNRETNQLQNNAITAVNAISRQLVNTPANGQFLLDKPLKSGDNVLAHTLLTIPVGYIVISQNAAATLFLIAKTNSTLTLNASAPVTVSLFVF